MPLPPSDDDLDGPQQAARPQQQRQPVAGQWIPFPPQQPYGQQYPWMPVWPAQPAVPNLPAKVKLPSFWPRDAAAWFELAESTFNRLNAQGSLLRYEYVLMALPEDILEKLRSVMMVARTVVDPYNLLKNRLVELFTPSIMERLNSIIWQPELGGRRPSELMEAMLALLPPGEQPGLLFKAHFLHRLPNDMRDRVALEITTLEPRALAALADQLYFVRNSGQPVAAVNSQASDELVAAMAKTNIGAKQSRDHGKQKQRGGGSGGGGRKLCKAHRIYGNKAYGCLDTDNCQWVQQLGNE